MKKKAIWIVLAVVLVGVLVGAGALYKKLSREPAAETTSDTVSQTDEASTAEASTTETALVPLTEEAADMPQTTAATPDAATSPAPAEPTEPAPTEAAADFTVIDTNGNEVSLSSHFGKPLVVNFWATWCGPCRNELPEFDAAAKKYAGQIDFMMVNLTDGYNDTVESVEVFVRENGYSFPVYYDTAESASAAYGLYSIPMTLFIRADGSIMQSYTGAMSGTVLNGFLEQLVQ